MKTNRLDSVGLAENLRGGQLKSIHVPSTLHRELCHLTQLRDALVSEVVAMKQRTKSLLLMEGLEFSPAPAGSQWSFLIKAKLRKLACSLVVRFKLDQLLDNLEFGEKQVLKATREIRRFCQNDPELSQFIEYLKTLPGIGWIVAKPDDGRYRGLAPNQKHSPVAGLPGVGTHQEIHQRENRSRLDYSQRRSQTAK